MPTKSSYEWYVITDPGTSGSAFAALFVALDRYLPFAYFLDEIYEKEAENTVTSVIGPRIIEKALGLNDDPTFWHCYYDSAAAWFATHFRANHNNPEKQYGTIGNCGLRFAPVVKRPGEKEDGLDTLNAMFMANAIGISQRCGNLIWEYDNYCRDKNGKLVKRNDHQVDNGRYFIKMAGVVMGPGVDRPVEVSRRKAKGTRDYVHGRLRPEKREGLAARIIKTYDYD